MAKNISSNVAVISSKHNVENWVALQDELPVPFMEVLFYSEVTDVCRVGYWDPLEEKVAISTVKLERNNDECISLCNAISEMNPSFRSATHWRYLPLQPISSKKPKKTIGQIVKDGSNGQTSNLAMEFIDGEEYTDEEREVGEFEDWSRYGYEKEEMDDDNSESFNPID